MDNKKNENNFIDNQRTDNNEKLFCSEKENFIFVADENIRAIERVINNWEDVKQKWDKLRFGNIQNFK